MLKFKGYLTESSNSFDEKVNLFVDFACAELDLDSIPKITLIDNKKLAAEQKSFGGYNPNDQTIIVNIAGRHDADVFRTLAHELTHYKQDLDGRIQEDSGDTGSDIENEANAMAGIIMRNFAKQCEDLFEAKSEGLFPKGGPMKALKNLDNGPGLDFSDKSIRVARMYRSETNPKKRREMAAVQAQMAGVHPSFATDPLADKKRLPRIYRYLNARDYLVNRINKKKK